MMAMKIIFENIYLSWADWIRIEKRQKREANGVKQVWEVLAEERFTFRDILGSKNHEDTEKNKTFKQTVGCYGDSSHHTT
jgi:hypothetical protein